jgi:hypothetical protein
MCIRGDLQIKLWQNRLGFIWLRLTPTKRKGMERGPRIGIGIRICCQQPLQIMIFLNPTLYRCSDVIRQAIETQLRFRMGMFMHDVDQFLKE